MTTHRTSRRLRRRSVAGSVILLLLGAAVSLGLPAAYGASYASIEGDGSSWAGNALAQWQADVSAQGVTVNYTADGSSTGRKVFAQGLTDFAVSEIPYTGDTSDPQDSLKPAFSYAQLPTVAGGTSFMYNLQVNGSQFEQLQLSQAALAGIFSGQITTWNDPAIAATNPGVNLPAQQITVVVRSDGSGATAEFTLWMLHQFPQAWAALCAKAGCDPASATSYYPTQNMSNFVAQSQSIGVTTYTANTPYTINYDEYSYALSVNFPVAQVQNAAGFFVTPTAGNVAVALTQAQIDGSPGPNYLSQDLTHVYPYGDPRTYPISAYSYLMVPTQTEGKFDTSHGATLGYFGTYNLCEGQQSMSALGYSPLPMNLVLAAMDQILKIPGVDSTTQATIASTKSGVASGGTNPCNNPTFKPGDDPAHNILVDTAPFPAGCDATCQAPWKLAAAATNTGVGGKVKKPKGTTGSGGPSTGPSTGTGTTTTGPGTTAPGTGTTTTDTGAGTTPLGPGGAPAAASPPACDAVTGVCTTPGATTTDGTTTAGGTPVSASTVIGGESTWGGPQLAIAICVLFGLMLVAGPAVVHGQLNKRRAGSPR